MSLLIQLPPRPVTQEIAAEYLGVSTRTIKRFVAAGSLAAVKVGRQIRIRPEALDAFLTQHHHNKKKPPSIADGGLPKVGLSQSQSRLSAATTQLDSGNL
jgi:excisionase family DNA binding protein